MNKPVELPAALVDLLTAQPERRMMPATVTQRPTDRYGAAALDGELARVRGAVNGTRNHTLNRAAYVLGQLVAAGALDRMTVENNLLDAALAVGLGEMESRNTINSGLQSGEQQPRAIPDPKGGAAEPPEPPPDDPYTYGAAAEVTQPELARKALLSADTILGTQWPEPVVIVPDILTAGLSILGGAAKLGKSWLGLQMVHGVAAGGQVLGRKVEAGPVLYLALEDPPRRLQERMVKQRWPRGLPADFITIGDYGPLVGDLLKGGAVRLGLMIEERQYRLVVVDTFSRAIFGDQMDVQEMTRALTPLQEMAHKQNCAVLLIDHHRKVSAGGTPDVIADILGSTAKGAMADNVIGLYRERGKAGAKLSVTGREISEQTLALKMDWELGCWQCEGEAGALEMTQRRQEILDALGTLGRAKLKDICEAVEQDKGNTFRRLVELVATHKVKKDGIYYVLP